MPAPAVLACVGTVPSAPLADADAVAFLVNVTVRPGYNFANADDALAYGHGICDNVAQGRTYAQIMAMSKPTSRPQTNTRRRI
ncbi:hypothetical protein MMAN_42380 [Mycobacterium mantenii]|uniref:DUF732 domain-containing protein n=1 Tax=Mycobacterium mantenii TaxID=560555 RepID=A0ABN6AHF8_MYCNT|nr:hypothetical protein MMAN_42380 [Mycobacterium mantenii]